MSTVDSAKYRYFVLDKGQVEIRSRNDLCFLLNYTFAESHTHTNTQGERVREGAVDQL